MEAICYVCNKKTTTWTKDLCETKSKHSRTPIIQFIEKLLNDYESQRNLCDKSNCICNICLSKFYAYDWSCVKAKEQEIELRMILMNTEAFYENCTFSSNVDGPESGKFNASCLNNVVHIISDENDDQTVDNKASVKIEVQQEFSEPCSQEESKPPPLEAVKKTEPIEKVIKAAQPIVKPLKNLRKVTVTKAVTPTEPPKKGKPIIVRVVKRVPFLKSNPADPTQPNATVKSETSNGNASSTSSVVAPVKPPVKPIVLRKQSKNVTIPRCKYCDGRFPNDKILQNHLKLHAKCSGYITCHICFFQMGSDKDSFKMHVKKHAQVPPKHCVLCDEGDAENFDLRNHVQSNHNGANLLCDCCGKTFVHSSALYKHRKSHFDERTEQCPYCPKAFKMKRSLKDHLDTHLNTEPAFACAFCDKRFKRKDHCRVHEKRHREDTKKFKCTLCPAAFEYKHDFNLHLQRKHDAELPHDKSRR